MKIAVSFSKQTRLHGIVQAALFAVVILGLSLYPLQAAHAQGAGSLTINTPGTNLPPGGTLVTTTTSLPAPVLLLPRVGPAFFTGELTLSDGTKYLLFSNSRGLTLNNTVTAFGYYAYLSDTHYIYHFDMGFEYVVDAADGQSGVYLYDFASNTFFYTSPSFPFPYLYDFTLKAFLYYFPDPANAGHYNTNGVRWFYNFATGQIISK